jgi:hypothetical protein
MAELADAPDSKSGSPQGECGFDPLFRHHPSLRSVWLPDERLRHAAPARRAGASGLDPLDTRRKPSLRSVWWPDERLRHAAPALAPRASGLRSAEFRVLNAE